MAEGDTGSDLDDRLDAIWRRTKPAVIERIETIERVTEAALGKDLAFARSEAHKLRGLLGTIGLAHGSELAARIEDELERAADGEAESGWEARIRESAKELRAEVDGR